MRRVIISQTPNLDKALTPELLGEAIKARRTQSHLRLEDAAALCGVAKQTMANIERGEARSQLDTVLRVCSTLGIELRIHPWSEIDEDEWQ